MQSQPSSLLWYPGHKLLLTDIVRAENCSVYDVQGTRYVDLESGVWCTSIGHAHPRVVQTIAAQAARIGHTGYSYSTQEVEQAAREILKLTGCAGGKCVFLCSGSEAVEYGVRLAQMVVQRPRLLTMTDSYFGAYGSASTKSADRWFTFDWSPCAGCPAARTCDTGCKHWAAVPHAEIGGFLFEPGSSSGMVRFPPQKLIDKIVATVRENDGLIIVNEVTTGVGRTGAWFGYQHYGFQPDIVAVGKGIGNGYPVSVTAVSPRVVTRLGDTPVKYAQSHQNDPLGAAVVCAVIEVIREGALIERAQAISAELLAGLEEIRQHTGLIRSVRGRGLMIAIEFEAEADADWVIWVHEELLRRGFILCRRSGSSVFRCDPSLTVERDDIVRFLATFTDVLAASVRQTRGA